MDGQVENTKPLNAADPADFKKIYSETMQMLFKISFRIVKNASLNYVKRKARERKAYEKALYEDVRIFHSGETELLKREAIKNTQDALSRLPPKLREVVVLAEYGDLNYKEIGKVVGITEGNVKVRIFRARKLLEEMIGAENVFLPN